MANETESPEIPPLSLEEYQRQFRIRMMCSTEKGINFPFDELLADIQALKDAKTLYFSTFKNISIPHYQRDASVIKRQIEYGKPFRMDDETQCLWCKRSRLRLANDKKSVLAQCNPVNFADCPDEDGVLSAFNYHWGSTLTEAKIRATNNWITYHRKQALFQRNYDEAEKYSKPASMLYEIETSYYKIVDVVDASQVPNDWCVDESVKFKEMMAQRIWPSVCPKKGTR